MAILLTQLRKNPGLWDIADDRIEPMIPGNGEKSHDKEKGPATWDISEAVLQ